VFRATLLQLLVTINEQTGRSHRRYRYCRSAYTVILVITVRGYSACWPHLQRRIGNRWNREDRRTTRAPRTSQTRPDIVICLFFNCYLQVFSRIVRLSAALIQTEIQKIQVSCHVLNLHYRGILNVTYVNRLNCCDLVQEKFGNKTTMGLQVNVHGHMLIMATMSIRPYSL